MANKTKIRVLHLGEAPVLGGISTFLLITAEEFAKRSDVEIVYAVLSDIPQGWFFDRMNESGFHVNQIQCNGPPDFNVPRRIRDFILENHIDLVHVHGYRSNFYVQIMRLKGLRHIPMVTTKHGLLSNNRLREAFYNRLDQMATRFFDRIISVDSYTLNVLHNEWHIPERKLSLIHNPAPRMNSHSVSEKANLRRKLNIHPDFPVYLYAGRIERDKGIFELLAAHKNLLKSGLQAFLLIIGDGSERLLLEEFIISEIPNTYIKYAGPQPMVSLYLNICDFAVLPSYHEGLPFIILEAMSAGKPVIATSVGGILDIVAHRENGILVKPKDVTGLLKAISYFVNNPAVLSRMGERAKRKVISGFTVQNTVTDIMSVYREIMNEKMID